MRSHQFCYYYTFIASIQGNAAAAKTTAREKFPYITEAAILNLALARRARQTTDGNRLNKLQPHKINAPPKHGTATTTTKNNRRKM